MISVLICTLALLQTINPDLMKKWGFVISQNKLEVDENLPDFFDSLKLKDKEWFLSENRRMKDVYAYMVANEETVTKMERY